MASATQAGRSAVIFVVCPLSSIQPEQFITPDHRNLSGHYTLRISSPDLAENVLDRSIRKPPEKPSFFFGFGGRSLVGLGTGAGVRNPGSLGSHDEFGSCAFVIR